LVQVVDEDVVSGLQLLVAEIPLVAHASWR
jgi:hypothetical protein